MENIKENLSLFQELISCSHKLYLWSYSSDFELLHTNCPNHLKESESIFLFNQAKPLLDYAQTGHYPFILESFLNVLWISVFERRENKLFKIHIIGPAFCGRNSYQQLKHKLDQRNFSVPARLAVLKQLDSIPILPTNLIFQYAIMLHYCITGEKIASTDLQYPSQHDHKITNIDNVLVSEEHPGIWAAEQEFLTMIREGNPNYKAALDKSSFLSSGIRFDTGDSLRKSKNNLLVLLTLISRAAIEGGLSPSTSYTLCDYYTQKSEDAKSISELTILCRNMLEDFIKRVQQTKDNAEISKTVQSCCDYISANINDKLSIEFLSKRAGYTEYYFSRKFKQEMRMSINQYIKNEKIRQAKLLLSSTNKSIQEIGDDLSFSSRSYFSDSFQKSTGISPSEYRRLHLKI
ncbi:helix-turn-helix domain-containing protein [Candidatus Galacturonibacter soehngenii]|uniref:AraC family transcriptional regulator n=1 Tax=Candidatus Galacturonatibacter soehngenii TaxID=2307010 RepID=A0A7V7UC86_9FIRM|nr:helix-turn-helix domain-containing protein [Candidatus Galacturonibacter soehngenii]KAB1438680.1 AraC family transcriptional regulator [Candidatus Galacturonibacter soehngenii]MBA4685720.1 AraC family transcriptional regulator [Candidatus Galacturonibacter soehngenii]